MSAPSKWAIEQAESICRFSPCNPKPDIAEALDAAREAGRKEMSDAIAVLLQRHLGVEPRFGWEARIMAVELNSLRREREAKAAGRVEGIEAAAKVCDRESTDRYIRLRIDEAATLEQAATAIRALLTKEQA